MFTCFPLGENEGKLLIESQSTIHDCSGFKDLCEKHTYNPPRAREFWQVYEGKHDVTQNSTNNVCQSEYNSWKNY